MFVTNGSFFFFFLSRPTGCWQISCEKSAIKGINRLSPYPISDVKEDFFDVIHGIFLSFWISATLGKIKKSENQAEIVVKACD